jgi:hypothetical protein
MADGPTEVRVREPEGNVVIVEFVCRDAYEAIEFAEILSAGIDEGGFSLDFEGGPLPKVTKGAPT